MNLTLDKSFDGLSSVSKMSQSSFFCLNSVSIYAYFEYITQGLDEAVAVFDNSITKLQTLAAGSRCPLEELMMESKLQLIYQHSLREGAFKPIILRQAIENSLRLYPLNTRFLSLLSYSEAKAKIENKLMRYLDDVLLKYFFYFYHGIS